MSQQEDEDRGTTVLDGLSLAAPALSRVPRKRLAKRVRAESAPSPSAHASETSHTRRGFLVRVRRQRGETQAAFWRMFGTGQVTGSRYETAESSVPLPVRMLVIALITRVLTEKQLMELADASKVWKLDSELG